MGFNGVARYNVEDETIYLHPRYALTNISPLLQKVDIESVSQTIRLGSLIITNRGNYFLAISMGKISIEDTPYFVVSVVSPIGKLLLGKQKGAAFVFNGMKFQIQKVN